MKTIIDWREESDARRRKELSESSCLNRLGQANYNGVQRSPVRNAPAQSMEKPPNRPWPKPTRW